MKLLLDQGLPHSAVTHLEMMGIDTVHTSEIGLATADDFNIIQHGLSEGRIIVTLDADFHMHIALSNAKLPSIIRIRIEGLGAEALARLLLSVLRQCPAELIEGALVSVTEGGVRIRMTPLVTSTPL